MNLCSTRRTSIRVHCIQSVASFIGLCQRVDLHTAHTGYRIIVGLISGSNWSQGIRRASIRDPKSGGALFAQRLDVRKFLKIFWIFNPKILNFLNKSVFLPILTLCTHFFSFFSYFFFISCPMSFSLILFLLTLLFFPKSMGLGNPNPHVKA